MRRLWLAVAALGSIVIAADARADTVYLVDGRSVWGKEVYEEGDKVIVVRPGGDLTFPKAEVSRIERLRSTLPPFYVPPAGAPAEASPPGAGPTAAPGTPATPGAPAAAGPTGPPATAGGASAPPTPPGGAPPSAPPAATGPAQLPPPPPPPPPGSYVLPR